MLLQFFIDQFNKEFRKNTQGISSQALKCLQRYNWPGNVRELKNVIERAMILETRTELDITDLPEELFHTSEDPPSVDSENDRFQGDGSDDDLIVLPENGISLKKVEMNLIRSALHRTNGNRTQAARLLRISRDALRYKMKKFGL